MLLEESFDPTLAPRGAHADSSTVRRRGLRGAEANPETGRREMAGKRPDNERVGHHGMGEPHGSRLEDSADECSVG